MNYCVLGRGITKIAQAHVVEQIDPLLYFVALAGWISTAKLS